MTLDFRSVLPQNYMSLCGVKSQPVQGRHMVSARSALRPRSSKIFLVELANFSSLSAEGLSTTTSPARSGCGDIGLKLGITPISASFFTPAKTHSSLSPRPSMKLEETLFLPKIFTASFRELSTYSSDNPGQYLAKIWGSIVSTLYLISAPASFSSSEDVSVG